MENIKILKYSIELHISESDEWCQIQIDRTRLESCGLLILAAPCYADSSGAADLSEADESQILSPFFLDIEESDEENWW